MSYLGSKLAVVVLASVLAASASSAQTSVSASTTGIKRLIESRLVRARRADGRVVVDGRLDDAAWRAAEVATDFVQQRPTPGAPASQRSEARVLFDTEALYVSLRLYDDHPDSLPAIAFSFSDRLAGLPLPPKPCRRL